MSEKRSGGSWLAGAAVGVAVGAIAGLLVAPRTGRETRKILRKSADALPEILPELAENLSSTVQVQADRLSEMTLQKWDETLLRLKDAIAAGVEAGIEASRKPTLGADSRLESQDEE